MTKLFIVAYSLYALLVDSPYVLILAEIIGLGTGSCYPCQQLGLLGSVWHWVAVAGSTNAGTEPSWIHCPTSPLILFLFWADVQSLHT